MIVRVLLLLLGLILGFSPAHGADRVAFVIGNSDYSHAQRLPNPGSDAEAVAASLERLGFVVTLQRDLSKAAFELALADFSEKADGADIALVYYAGHGMELSGQNYLVPVDARLKTDLRVKFETVSLDDVLTAVQGARGLKLVLLDACRDNPFAVSMTRRVATRSLGRGLAKVETEPGVLVSFAAAAGTVAEDGVGAHSPYTTALLEHLETPGLELSLLFRKVADDVQKRTNGRQTPFEYGRLPGTSIFLKPAELPPQRAETKPDLCRDASAHWSAVSETGNADLIREHLTQFGDCAFAGLARHALAQLAAGSNKTEAAPAGDAAIDVAKKPDQPVEVAALPTEQTLEQTVDVQPEVAAKDETIPADLALSVQQQLDRLGCEPGKPDGLWGARSRRAMEAYNRESGASLATQEPSLAALEALSKQTERVCPVTCGPLEIEDGGRCVAKTCPEGQTLNSRGQCYTPSVKNTAVSRENRKVTPRSNGQVQNRTTSKTRATVRVEAKPVERRPVQRAEPFTKKCVVMTFCDN